MRKSIVTAAVLLTVIAGGASATEIKTFNSAIGGQYKGNGTDGYNVTSISDDGRYIGVQSTGNAAGLWEVATNTWINYLGTATMHGVASWAGSTTNTNTRVVNFGYNITNPPQQSKFGMNLAGGFLKPNPTSGGNVVVPAAFNSVTVDYATGNGWIVGHGNNTGFAGKGFAHKIANGNLVVGTGASTWEQSLGTTTTNGGLNSASIAGVGVGISSTLGPILADLNNNSAGSILDLTPFAGADAAGGGANAISANATISGTTTGYIGGFFKVGGWRHGFLTDITTGTGAAAVELLSLDGSYVSGDETEVLDVSNNGIAVGYDLAGGVRTAVVWLPGQTQAVSLVSIMNETLPGDGSISGLSAITSITADPNITGAYTVAGQAVMSDFTAKAFVATILPEPATLAFLALGGLAMLRRRR